MPRPDGRRLTAMRPVSIEPHVNPYAEGSAVCSFGNTKVLCTASVEESVPRWLVGQGRGWVTAEYAMLPRSTHTRTSRDAGKGGRAREISRLIGRSLRGCVDLAGLDGYTVRIDCDVLVADGGTRTASISGGYVALALALAGLGKRPLHPLAAVSVGKREDELITDLNYEEDSSAQVDLNLVVSPGPKLVEVQATAEDGFYTPSELMAMVEMGCAACEEIFALQAKALAAKRA